VTLNKILAPHLEQTVRRIQPHRVVLAVQDTTELDYTAHPLTEGLGPIGNHRKHVQGLMLHPTIAYSTTGAPLGLVDLQCWKRDGDHKIKFRKPVEEKESVKWLKSFAAAERVQTRCPQTTVISVGDCEADLYELFLQARKSASGTKFLVRAYRPRVLEENGKNLWTHLGEKDPAGIVTVKLPRRGSRKARVAELLRGWLDRIHIATSATGVAARRERGKMPKAASDRVNNEADAPVPPSGWVVYPAVPSVSVRFGAVTIKAPDYMKEKTGVSLWAVMLQEQNPPAGAQPVEWLLLTNLPVESFEQAVEKSQWYSRRGRQLSGLWEIPHVQVLHCCGSQNRDPSGNSPVSDEASSRTRSFLDSPKPGLNLHQGGFIRNFIPIKGPGEHPGHG